MRFLRRLVAPVVFAAAALSPLAFAATPPSEMTIVYVDIDRIISDVDEGKQAQAQLAKEQQKRQAQIVASETKLKNLQNKVQKLAGAGTGSAALQQAAAEYQQAALEYQQLLQLANKEMVDKEKELFDPIERRVKEVLRSIATKEGVDVVLSRRAISYARKDLDLSERVTQEYNKLHPVAKTAAPAAPASGKPPAAPATSATPPASAKPTAAPPASAKPTAAPPSSAKPAGSAPPKT